jgi:hypothetical protein
MAYNSRKQLLKDHMITKTTGKAFEWSAQLPRFQRIGQEFSRPQVEDIQKVVFDEISALPGIREICKGKQIAITAGSRGISQIPQILAAISSCLKEFEAQPFIVPAMGSHAGATADGQEQMLANLGITQATTGAPVRSSMEVIEVGRLPNGMPVYVDRTAASADGIVICNRVKPHTDFASEIESGLAKMAVFGLGKEKGAATAHSYGVEGLQTLMPEAARLVVARTPVLFGLAVIENAYHEVARIAAVPKEGIGGVEERELLKLAYSLMPRFPFPEIDVLVVEEMGKNISGVGMDPKVIGRVKVHGVQDLAPSDIRTIAVLDLTPEAHGNSSGIGLADVTTRRLVEKIDLEALYINCATAGICGIQRAAIPMVAPDDRSAILTALRVCGQPDPLQARVVRIKNTLSLGEIDISEALAQDLVTGNAISRVGQFFNLEFDSQGTLLPFERVVVAAGSHS